MFVRALRILALAAAAATVAPPAAADLPSPVNDPALIAAAKKEGGLSFYGSMQLAQFKAVAGRFQETYGIPVDVLRLESTDLPARVTTEVRSGHAAIDVVSNSGFQMDLLKRQGFLAQFRPPEDAAMLPGTYDPEGYWSSALINTETIAYNPARLQAAGLKPPRSWEDLANPQWRGHLGLFVGSYEWYAALKKAYGQAKADALMRAIAANQPRMLGSKQLGITMIEAGDIWVAPNEYGYNALFEQRKGLPIDFVNPVPTVIEPYIVSVMKNAPHPNAARLMIRWWLSRETQQWAKDELGRISARKDVRNDPRLMGPDVKFLVSDPSGSPYYAEFVKAFNEFFSIPG